MQGIAGELKATHEGTIKLEIITNRGDVAPLCFKALYVPDMNCRLLSPQSFIDEKGPSAGAKFRMKYGMCTFSLQRNTSVHVKYDAQTRLPVLRCFRNVIDSAQTLALSGYLYDETNQNLSWIRKCLLKMHVKLGHLGFGHVQWLGRKGFFGKLGEKFGKTEVELPKCASCQFSK